MNTAHSGFLAYDLVGTSNARILWRTGRGNYQRNGFNPPKCLGDFSGDDDVDGLDLAVLINNPSATDLVVFADNFGRTDCMGD